MTRYALAHHVFVCLQDEHVVFLDVRKDRYFTLQADQTRSLSGVVRGWPVHEAANTETSGSIGETTGPAVLAPLVERGLLMSADQAGKDATPVQLEMPVEELSVEGYDGTPRISALAVFRFVTAAFAANLALRRGRFDGVIDKARHLRRAQAMRDDPNAPEEPLDRARAHDLVATFASLRPFFYTSKDACLFEALALGKFLASYRVYPRWVFGVQARPFAAHCWLQQDGVVLNDTVEYVSRYTPIMVV